MSIAFSKINNFVLDVGQAKHTFGTDTLYLMLSNAITASTAHVLSDITQVTGTGYTANGKTCGASIYSQTSGTATLTVTTTSLVWTATASDWGAMRYAILYNTTNASKGLIGYWDYGSSITLINTDTFTADLSAGILTLA